MFFCVATGLSRHGGTAVAASCPVAPVGSAAVKKETAQVLEVSALDDNQNEIHAVQNVCTACRSSFRYLSPPHSRDRGERVFAQMTDHGAHPFDERSHIVRYFQRNSTCECQCLAPRGAATTMQLNVAATNAVIDCRKQKKFSGIDDLVSVPGVDKSVLDKLKTNLQF